MTPENVFSIANLIALAGWIALAAQPRRRWVPELLCGRAIPALLSVLYAILIASHWGQSDGGFSSLDAVARLFESRWLLLAGWVHYLAFDLFVGSWVASDAVRRNIPQLLLVPFLALTFLFGPAGFVAYLALRSLLERKPAALAGAAGTPPA